MKAYTVDGNDLVMVVVAGLLIVVQLSRWATHRMRREEVEYQKSRKRKF